MCRVSVVIVYNSLQAADGDFGAAALVKPWERLVQRMAACCCCLGSVNAASVHEQPGVMCVPSFGCGCAWLLRLMSVLLGQWWHMLKLKAGDGLYPTLWYASGMLWVVRKGGEIDRAMRGLHVCGYSRWLWTLPGVQLHKQDAFAMHAGCMGQKDTQARLHLAAGPCWCQAAATAAAPAAGVRSQPPPCSKDTSFVSSWCGCPCSTQQCLLRLCREERPAYIEIAATLESLFSSIAGEHLTASDRLLALLLVGPAWLCTLRCLEHDCGFICSASRHGPPAALPRWGCAAPLHHTAMRSAQARPGIGLWLRKPPEGVLRLLPTRSSSAPSTPQVSAAQSRQRWRHMQRVLQPPSASPAKDLAALDRQDAQDLYGLARQLSAAGPGFPSQEPAGTALSAGCIWR